MITPDAFVAAWRKDRPLIRFPKRTLDALPIRQEDKDFLAKAGLPESAAPFLSFKVPYSRPLATIAEMYSQPQQFRRYRAIGFDGAGNPIAIDETNHGQVVCLDHENGFASELVNTSVRQLAQSLLAYERMIRNAIALIGENAFLDGKIPASIRDELKRELKGIDPAAVKSNCFWHGELQNLDADANVG
ncbi:MAG: SUKH-4 family immunity protein [Tepidisphaeraceae bacterium]|jgi:hypothetical protein